MIFDFYVKFQSSYLYLNLLIDHNLRIKMVNKNNMFYIMVLIVFILNRDDSELGFEYFSTQHDTNSKSLEISKFIWGKIGFNFL